MSVSIFTSNAFSIRSAISPDRSALPFSRLERAGRETRRTLAAAVTDKPRGSTISVRMKSPGWGGFAIRITISPCLLVVVLEIHIIYFVFGGVDPERQPAVAGHMQTPGAFAVSRQGVGLPGRKVAQFILIFHVAEICQHLAQLVHRFGRKVFGPVLSIEAL